MSMNLSKGIKITVVEPTATTATGTLTTDILDMAGYEGVMFIATTNDATDGTVLTLTVLANSANSTSSPTPISQKSSTYTAVTASDADNKVLFVDLYKPTLRYVYATLGRATQACAIGGIIAIQYGAHNQPTTQDATVIASAFGLGVAS